MKEFKILLIISQGRSKFWQSPKIPRFGNFSLGSFWKYDIHKAIFPEFYGDSFCFFIKSLKIFFFIFQKSDFFKLKKVKYRAMAFLALCYPPYTSKTTGYFSIYISIITQKRLVGEKTYENKSCLFRRFTSNLLICFTTINGFWFLTILMIRGCTY